MRGRPLILILLLLVLLAPAADAVTWRLLVHRYHTEPGWHTERFSVDSFDTIAVSVGIDSDDELAASVVALFDGAEKPLATIVLGKARGQLVDVHAGTAGVLVSNEDLPGLGSASSWEQVLYLRCDATCNPSRVFKLAVSGGGELDAWGYGVFARNGTLQANLTGSAAWAIPSRELPAQTVAHVTASGMGASVVMDGALDVPVSGKLVGAWVKDSAVPAQRMAIVLPNDGGEAACQCILNGWAPGTYGLRYRDTDTSGREAYFIAADVQLP